MTQTQVSGSGIKNNVITNNHLHSAANIAGSKLADSGVTAGSYGSSSATLSLTINAKGLITAASTNAITQVGGSNGVDFNDNVKARFGTGNDLQIFHSSNIDKIESNGAGLHIRQINNGDVHIHAGADSSASNNRIVGRSAGAAELYYSGSKKFETTANGVEVTGSIFLAGKIDMGDSSSTTTGRILLGTGDDLQIYHNGNNSIIQNHTGNLRIEAKQGELGINIVPDADVALYYDNSKKFETTSSGVTLNGDLVFGNSSSYDIQLQGGKIYGDDGAINTLEIRSTSGNVNHARISIGEITNSDNGGIVFYGAGSSTADKKLTIRGTTDTVEIPDNHKFVCGDGSDLQIYHDGSNSYLQHTGTGDLFIDAANGASADLRMKAQSHIYAQVNGNETAFQAFANGAVELYYDNELRLKTQVNHLELYGNASESNLEFLTGTSSIVTRGIIGVTNNGTMSFYTNDGTQKMAVNLVPSGAVQLKHNASTKFETTSLGATVTGRLKQTTGCAFRARATTDGQSIPANTPTKVNFGTQVYDYGNVYNPSNSRFTAPVDGVYNFSWSVRMGTPTSTPKLDAEIRVNGNPNVNYVNCGYNQQASNNAAWIGSGDMFMSAGDYAELFVDQNTSSTTTLTDTSNANTLNPGNHIWWTGHLIHAA